MSDVTVQATTPWAHITLDQWSDAPDGAPSAGRQNEHEDPSCELAVLSVNGPDCVGFVAGISNWLDQHDIGIKSGHAGLLSSACDTSRAAYGAQYMLSAEPAGMERLRQTLRSDNLPVPEEPGIPEDENDTRPPLHYHLTVVASDNNGVHSRVSRLLATNRVSITAELLQTIPGFGAGPTARRKARPSPGLFRLHMDVAVPQANAREIVKQVRNGLNFFGSEFGWGVKFDESLTTARLMRAACGFAGCDF